MEDAGRGLHTAEDETVLVRDILLGRTLRRKAFRISGKKTFPKTISDFRKKIGFGSKSLHYRLHMILKKKCFGFSSRCFGYHISDVVSDIRKAFCICYDVSPKFPRRVMHTVLQLASIKHANFDILSPIKKYILNSKINFCICCFLFAATYFLNNNVNFGMLY